MTPDDPTDTLADDVEAITLTYHEVELLLGDLADLLTDSGRLDDIPEVDADEVADLFDRLQARLHDEDPHA